MQFFTAGVVECTDLGGSYSWLRLDGCEALQASTAGQFVMLRGTWNRDPVLPRAYSVLWVEDGIAEFLVRRVGRGSELLATSRPGDAVTVLGPLGRGFPSAEAGVVDLLVAGGCGVAPLYHAARRALSEGRVAEVRVLVGAKESCDLVLLDRLVGLGVHVASATEDGSVGQRGLVTDLLEGDLRTPAPLRARVLACGPEAMLRAVREVTRRHGVECYLSLEAPMACGLGACMGCAVPARERPYLYVCQDGPVVRAEEVWP